ncbi:hypothetical protein [Paeniglutamicibacter cryotolerans]|uniref:Uncharacterized protein n=1 Tax=Paeniglutamicibacter cryotolerans TaxID=670079 RepID=A0A839QHM6_9MICC|nr:hypothetical protein [Paeniglutamicibacter cryotolerans]MBB2995390.1 hypothetical protein [Paeniglutamicibacter cryotolerans]
MSEDLPGQLSALVAGVAGVARLYHSEAPPVRIAADIIDGMAPGLLEPPLVLVAVDAGETLRVQVTIGIARGANAPTVSHCIFREISARLDLLSHTGPRDIRITVASVGLQAEDPDDVG